MTRLAHAWRGLEHDQQLAAIAAIGLFVSMFLPWYSQTNTVVVNNAAKSTETSLSAFAAFSFVEAAVLLVSGGVLLMLFARAERRSFQLPGGDGTIVMIAGCWAALLIFYRMLDKPGLSGTQRITATVGLQWGIFIALAAAGLLAYAGARMRAGRRPQPPLTRAGAGPPPEGASGKRSPAPTAARASGGVRSSEPPLAGGERSPVRSAATTPSAGGREGPRPRSGRPRYPPAPAVPPRDRERRPLAAAKGSEQLSFEDPGPEPGRRPA
jgi:hypothetical protein